MKFRDDIVIAPANGESILVDASGKFKGMIKLNESAAFIASIFEKDTSIEDAIKLMINEYDVDIEKARNDINEFVFKMKEVGLFDEK